MSNNTPFSAFEKSAYKFIDELKKISVEANVLHKSEVRKADILIYGIKAMINTVKKDIEDIEKDFEDKS